MSCNRAQEIDLLAFFADPRSEELAEFRDHYPVCADCSCEVRAWSEVDALLREAGAEHPEAADLLRFLGEPSSFDTARRVRLASHLEGCASCRDEAGAIRTFLAAQTSCSSVTATASDASRSAPEAPGWLEKLRAALWSPAFAYGLLVLLCVPLLSDYWSGGPTATFERIDDAAMPAQKSQQIAPEPDRSDAAELRDEPARAPEVAPAQEVSDPKPSATRDLRSESATLQQAKREAPVPPPAEAPASKPAEVREYEGFADRAPELELRKRSRVRREASGQIAQESGATDSGLRSSAPAESQVSPVSVRREGDQYRIRIRNTLGLSPGSGPRVELRLIQGDGARALVERMKAEAEVFEIRVPVSWLAVGAHQIELRDVDANAVLARYPLSIP